MRAVRFQLTFVNATSVILFYNLEVDRNLFLGIPGIIVILLSAVSAIILNLGIKNGRRNVEKMLNVLNRESDYSGKYEL